MIIYYIIKCIVATGLPGLKPALFIDIFTGKLLIITLCSHQSKFSLNDQSNPAFNIFGKTT